MPLSVSGFGTCLLILARSLFKVPCIFLICSVGIPYDSFRFRLVLIMNVGMLATLYITFKKVTSSIGVAVSLALIIGAGIAVEEKMECFLFSALH